MKYEDIDPKYSVEERVIEVLKSNLDLKRLVIPWDDYNELLFELGHRYSSTQIKLNETTTLWCAEMFGAAIMPPIKVKESL